MTDLEQAARMALEALENLHATVWGECPSLLNEDSGGNSSLDMDCKEAITAIRKALAEQPAKQRHIAYVCPQCHWTLEEQPAQQEHKPWCASLSSLMFKAKRPCDCKRVPFPPPQRKPWAGLTEEEIDQGLARSNYVLQTARAWRDGVKWAQSQLKDRNA